MSICCEKCRAKRPNLHTFTEKAGIFGSFDVVRCLLCGWQLCRLKPWKRRRLSEVEELVFDEETKREADFLDFASNASVSLNPYLSPRF